MSRNLSFHVRIIVIILFLIYFQSGNLNGETVEIVKPSSSKFHEKKEFVSDHLKTYENRKVLIEFEAPFFYPEIKIKVKDIVRITLFDNTIYDCIVETIDKNPNGTISVSGKIKDHDFSTFILSLDNSNFILYMKDLNKNYEYSAYGSVSDKIGIITEINVAKRPALKHLSPIHDK